jgi:hypothetical protein
VAHGKKEVRKAIGELQALGCDIEQTPSGHRWGVATAPDGARHSIWSTPRSPENHARELVRRARKHQ